MKYLFIGLGMILITFVYSACIVSSRYSKIEEIEELKERIIEKK